MSIIALASIRIDGGTQLRDAVSPATVADYTEAFAPGPSLPANRRSASTGKI